MKTSIRCILVFSLFVGTAYSQVPQLINYQGIARDDAGKVLQDKALALRLSIVRGGPMGDVVYSEVHDVVTNSLGLFTLPIGGGRAEVGTFSSITWSKDSFWLKVEMDPAGGSNFRLLGASQLLTVPYAFESAHAAVAAKLESNETGGKTTVQGSPGTPWVIGGNATTNPTTDFLGTTDKEDLVFRTNNIERMRLSYIGNIGVGTDMPMSLFSVAGNLAVGSGYAGTIEAPPDGAIIEGRVGIGTTHPVSELDVAGGAVIGHDFAGANEAPLNGALVEGRVGIGTAGPGSMLGVNGGLAVGQIFSGNSAPTSGAIIEGRVGIGTTIPQSALGVNGGISVGFEYSKTYPAPDNGGIFEGNVGVGTTNPVSTLAVGGNLAVGHAYAGSTSAPTEGALFEGTVGIGTTTPQSKLSVTDGLAVGGTYAGGSAAPGNGAIIEGNVGIGTPTPSVKLEVNGDTKITGNELVNGTLDVDGITTVHNATQSTAPGNGALVVTGGEGIGKDLWIGENLTVNGDGLINGDFEVKGTSTFNDLIVTHDASIGHDLSVGHNTSIAGQTHITNATQSTSITTGALVVDGGTGIGKNLNVGGNTNVTGTGTFGGQVKINATLNGNSSNPNNFPLYINGSKQGIAIRINESRTHNNYFAGFWDPNGLQGRIEGQTAVEILTDPVWILQTIIDAINLVFAITDQISAATSVNVCAGFGVVVCPPIASFNIGAAIKLVAAIAQPILTQAVIFSHVGVSYSSGSADYAEWLPRMNPDEKMTFGDIVGVVGGRITKNTVGADHLMVVSAKPAVVGNQPPQDQEKLYEKCGFLGQVPVKVLGPVNVGDYILPSDRNDGSGVAVAPDKMTVDDYARVVGRAWSASTSTAGLDYVNTAIGIGSNDLAEVAKRQESKIDSLSSEVDRLKQVLRSIVPDFDLRMAQAGEAQQQQKVLPPAPAVNVPIKPDLKTTFGDHFIDPALMAQAFKAVEKQYRDQGIEIEKYPGLKKLFDDSAYQKMIVGKLQDRFNTMVNDMDKMQAAAKNAATH